MKVISYSLFGYNKERQAGCDNFSGYLCGFMINMRLARLLFPGWIVRIHLDKNTYEGLIRFWELLQPPHCFDSLQIIVCEDAPLTKAMLWRMKPAFDKNVEIFICRDTDAPLTYRDAQAVKEWELSPKQAHAITDSVSHTIPMMGGMIGFKTQYFKDYTGYTSWDVMVNQMSGYEIKGVDQDFLGRFIYPKYAHNGNSSIMEHCFLGYTPANITDGYRRCMCPSVKGHNEDCPLNISLSVSEDLKESNGICGHIGAAGNYQIPTYNFLRKYKEQFKDLQIAESTLPNIFIWNI